VITAWVQAGYTVDTLMDMAGGPATMIFRNRHPAVVRGLTGLPGQGLSDFDVGEQPPRSWDLS
jgi:hypothetical protein